MAQTEAHYILKVISITLKRLPAGNSTRLYTAPEPGRRPLVCVCGGQAGKLRRGERARKPGITHAQREAAQELDSRSLSSKGCLAPISVYITHWGATKLRSSATKEECGCYSYLCFSSRAPGREERPLVGRSTLAWIGSESLPDTWAISASILFLRDSIKNTGGSRKKQDKLFPPPTFICWCQHQVSPSWQVNPTAATVLMWESGFPLQSHLPCTHMNSLLPVDDQGRKTLVRLRVLLPFTPSYN